MSRQARACAAAVALVALVAGCGEPASDDSGDAASAGFSTVTFRLWDEAAASAYRESFDAFNAINRDVHVDVEVVPQESYAEEVAADLADGTMADIFWTTSDAVAAHAHAGDLVELDEALGEDHEQWEPAVTDLFTRDDVLWAVPQLWDSTVLFYNTELVDRAGVDPTTLTWDPAVVQPPPVASSADADPAGDARAGEPAAPEASAAPTPEPAATPEPVDDTPTDTLRQAVRDLTRDDDGRTASEEGFDPGSVAEYGINTDLTAPAVWLPFLAQLGAVPHEELTLTGPEGRAAFGYLAELPAAPPVGDPTVTARELFTAGRMALFQSTSADMRHVAEHAEGDWGLAPVPAGPDRSVAVVDGVAAAVNAASPNPEATIEVLHWIASADGQSALASHGVGVPAATGAQDLFLRAWADRGVDASAALEAPAVVTAATGPRAQDVLQSVRPVLDQLYRGELPLAEALATAQVAAETELGS
ncbi:ABC transporter substrate-binding protein [Georgenia sp. H159]|uniref:ABC transporter substrate-binding protein n=1 Tax=Georgenia sp. H159 TaxID=3076115 RepID=UPI002D78BC4A|nr:extracellular solute-binding protein [Georgenia sp. H159]